MDWFSQIGSSHISLLVNLLSRLRWQYWPRKDASISNDSPASIWDYSLVCTFWYERHSWSCSKRSSKTFRVASGNYVAPGTLFAFALTI